MIDYQNEIFTAIKKAVAAGMPEANVTGQVGADPSRLPCVQAEEIGNLPVEWDSGAHSEYALLTWRVRAYSNLKSGRIAQARKLLSIVDEAMENMNFTRRTFEPLPALYNNSAYEIEATYTAVIRSDGLLFRR